jgi:hypothetical protein
MQNTEAYKEGSLVVVRIQSQGTAPGWFVGMVMRPVSGGYLVRLSFPREYRRPVYEVPKRRWYTRARKKSKARERDGEYEYEFQSAWSGWVEIPRDPMFVLFSRITSQSFRNDIRDRLREGDDVSETITERVISAGDIFFPDPQKLFRVVFA